MPKLDNADHEAIAQRTAELIAARGDAAEAAAEADRADYHASDAEEYGDGEHVAQAEDAADDAAQAAAASAAAAQDGDAEEAAAQAAQAEDAADAAADHAAEAFDDALDAAAEAEPAQADADAAELDGDALADALDAAEADDLGEPGPATPDPQPRMSGMARVWFTPFWRDDA